MAIKYAINGFGRIGRNVVRAALGHSAVELVAVNDLTDSATLAHLLKYDSAQGMFRNKVSVEGNMLLVDDERIQICLLYTSDAADERSSVDLGGRRIIKKKKRKKTKRKKKKKKKTNSTT